MGAKRIIPIISIQAGTKHNNNAGLPTRFKSEIFKDSPALVRIITNAIRLISLDIDITDSSDYIVYMDSEGKKIYLGDAIDLNTKILHLKEILNQNKGKTGEIFLDMDLNEYDSRFRESY